MKISKQQLQDLQILIDHAEKDIQYREGGTYYNPDNPEIFDTKKATRALRAIDFINKLITEKK